MDIPLNMNQQEITITPQFLSAEPITNDIVAITTVGAVDLTEINVSQNGEVKINVIISIITRLTSFTVYQNRKSDHL